jgi:hypothetical protein
MTTVAVDTGRGITVSSPRLDAGQSLASELTAARQDVLDARFTDPDGVVTATLCALERHLLEMSLPDVLELRVLVDTTEQALDHLTTWH